jgi:Zn-dependent peptidase ImmA (M78 family)
MAGRRGGKWSDRPSLGQIEELAGRKIAQFQRSLQAAGLSVPDMPPVPVEYLALTVTELSLRSISRLSHEGRRLAGMLDMDRAEIIYEDNDPTGRQNFTIAHELGHYFLHYLPALELARQPTLFDVPHPELDEKLARSGSRPARFFRCTENELSAANESETEAASITSTPAKIGRQELEDHSTKTHLAKIIRLRELQDRIEWEANIFARSLLMPSELVRRLNKKHAGDVNAMAAELAVTPTALRYRLNGLGLRQDEGKGLGPNYQTGPKTPNSPQQGTFF